MSTTQANFAQVRLIRHYHRSLLRQGSPCNIEQAACQWIRRYAALWRAALVGGVI